MLNTIYLIGEMNMSVLFTPKKIGPIEVKNRFVSAPMNECMTTETGEVTDQLINRYRVLAKGGVGLIIPGYMFVSSTGKSVKLQKGIHEDRFIPGLRKLTEVVHEHDCKIFFELAHAGRQTFKGIIGQTPLAPSAGKADPVFRVKPRAMTNDEIKQTINDFGEAARRATDSGADGILIGAACGFLLNEFLSPFFNHRTDEWGGSEENNYRIMRETIQTCRKAMNKNMALIVKLCTNDYTPKQGITPDLAKKYVEFLVQDGIDGLVTSQGTMAYSNMNVWRGDVPVSGFLKIMPFWMRPIGWLMMRRWVGKYDLEEAWNLPDDKLMKTVMGNTPLFLDGGLRKLATMQKIVEEGEADFVSLGRPLVREPNLVNKFKNGETEVAACVSCNKCMVMNLRNLPLRCYYGS
jgi:2,4-dienoyl-CoA reductase-like NADH-dependent reductase (Old Yellow Enzyme family)